MSTFSFSLTDAASPLAALEITGGRVVGIALDERAGRPVVAAHAVESLPDGAVVPSLNALNLRDRPTTAAAVARVLERIGRPRRVGLVLGDPAVKVSLVKLQQVPSRQQDLEQVIRWQVRKTTPFAIEDAQVAFEPGLSAPDGQEFLVTVARRDVVAEYEATCRAAGAHAGLVDISTFNVVNLVLASGPPPPGDWLLVNLAPGWESVAIMRGAQLVFFRNRGADGEGTLADLVHQTAMYYEDRLGGTGFGRVLVAGAASVGESGDVRRSLTERLATQVDLIDPLRVVSFADRINADAALAESITPLVGLVLRTREAA